MESRRDIRTVSGNQQVADGWSRTAAMAWTSARAVDRAPGVGLDVGRSDDWSGPRDEKNIEKKEKNRNGPARFGPRSDFRICNSFLFFQTFL
jgi:hypothetical protein